MIAPTLAKLISILPDKLVIALSKQIMGGYIKKYAHITVKGETNLENIQTPTIFICNHLSNSDGLVLNKALHKINPTFVAGVKLSNDPVTNLGIHVVKTTTIKPNSTDKEGINRIIKLIKQGESLLIFPEGTRSRVGSLIEAKKGVLFIAKITGAPIVPIGLSGTEKLMPINTSNNMSAETFHHANVCVNIGKQFTLPKRTKEQDKKAYEAFAITYLMKQIAALLPEEYKGVYK